MGQKQLSKWLKIIVLGMGLLGTVLYVWLVPRVGRDLVHSYPEFSSRYVPWLVALWISAVPCYVVLGYVWKLAKSIGEDQSFTKINARRLKRISYLAVGDVSYFFVVNCIYLLLGMSHPGVVLFSGLVVFVGIAFGVVAAALSHLVQKASDLQEENDGTV